MLGAAAPDRVVDGGGAFIGLVATGVHCGRPSEGPAFVVGDIDVEGGIFAVLEPEPCS